MMNTFQTLRHTFISAAVLFFLCLFPLPILLQEVCDLLWH